MQGGPILAAEPRSLPPGKIMPDYFRVCCIIFDLHCFVVTKKNFFVQDLGYSTHLVGKWHLGMARWNDTPTYRGFDHHLGNLNGFVSYYDYLSTWAVSLQFCIYKVDI